MAQAFIVVLREGFEAFLIVAITIAFLRKTLRGRLVKAVFWGAVFSVATSGGMGYFLWKTRGVHTPLLEGILGLVTVVLVLTLVVHMWRIGPMMKQEMEHKLGKITQRPVSGAQYLGIFLFTVIMVTREGMETALLLLQIHQPHIVAGILLGILGAGLMAWAWQTFGYLINWKHFFQVTSVYLILFTAQIAVQAFHEFTEAGIFPNSETLHVATEPYSTDGHYGRLYSWWIVGICAAWYLTVWVSEKVAARRIPGRA